MNRTAYIIIFLLVVFVSAVSQLLLKRASNQVYKNRIAEYMNPLVISAYSLFFLASLLTAWAYKGVPITLGPILESTGYIYIAVLSVIFLKEKISRRKIIGNILIILGVVVATLF